MPKIVATSDVHYRFSFEVSQCDLLIIAGDMLGNGSLPQLAEFNAFLARNRSKFRECIVTPGNHDKIFQTDLQLAKATLTNARVLIDEPYEVDGLKIWASPWTPTFLRWYFMKDRGESIRRKWDLIPEGLDVLITHGPPHGILDMTDGRYGPAQSVGCEELRKRIDSMERPPRLHIFGHIHHSYGTETHGGTTYANVSLCNEDYDAVNPPIAFNLERPIETADQTEEGLR